jgi:uncharacterized protein
MTVGALGRNRKMPFVSRAFSALGALCVCALLLILAGAHQVRAQGSSPLSSSYITPFPQTDRYQVRVIGDWLGAGLTGGLKEAFKLEEGSLQIADMSRSNYGLARADQTDLYREIDRMISDAPPHIVIIMLGVNDRASLKYGDGRAQPGSAEWKETYAKEAERLVKKLRGAKIAVYWVGLPIMANAAFSETVAAMNDAARQAAYVNGAKFIETWAGFTDQLGAYAAYGPDLTGQTKRLRDGDGIGLTPAGNRKLANYVEIVLRRDLAQAKAQRNIPLAGDEEEQARVVPGVARPSAKSAAAREWTTTASQPAADLANPSASKPQPGVAVSLAQRSEAGAPPATPDPQRRDAAAFGGAGFQGGEYVLADLGDGLTSIAVISPVGDFSMREIQRQTPLADRVYFKVLSRGDALPPKEGRADDFHWPPPPEASSQ